MGSKFELRYSDYFLEQWGGYEERTRRLILDKFKLIKLNPFRYEAHKGYKRVFKVKITIENKYSRLMYSVFDPDSNHIRILGIFDRNLSYKDFERIFGHLKKH